MRLKEIGRTKAETGGQEQGKQKAEILKVEMVQGVGPVVAAHQVTVQVPVLSPHF